MLNVPAKILEVLIEDRSKPSINVKGRRNVAFCADEEGSEGFNVGIVIDLDEGFRVGLLVGIDVNLNVGLLEGCTLGFAEGLDVGFAEG